MQQSLTEYGRGVGTYGDFGRYTFQRILNDWRDFDVQALSNWACAIIFEKYGYNVELHADFDKNASSGNRHENKTERIGKKYQRMAMYEVIARVADNFKIRDNSSRPYEKKTVWFEGPWEPFVRDIDPSSPRHLSPPPADTCHVDWTEGTAIYEAWDGSDESWLADSNGLPDPKKLIDIEDLSKESWVCLETGRTWEDPFSSRISQNNDKRRLWYQIRSYFVKESEAKTVTAWLNTKHFMGRHLPESAIHYQIFAHEYHWSPAYQYFDKPYFGRVGWESVGDNSMRDKPIGKVMPTVEAYR